MIALHSIEDLSLLRESVSLECKLANGRDGKGALSERYEPQEHSVLEMAWAMDTSVQPGSGESSALILALLAQYPKLTVPALARRLRLTRRAVEKQLSKLKEQGRLRRIGPNKGGHWEVLEP